jgi:hypothetical protein
MNKHIGSLSLTLRKSRVLKLITYGDIIWYPHINFLWDVGASTFRAGYSHLKMQNEVYPYVKTSRTTKLGLYFQYIKSIDFIDTLVNIKSHA